VGKAAFGREYRYEKKEDDVVTKKVKPGRAKFLSTDLTMKEVSAGETVSRAVGKTDSFGRQL